MEENSLPILLILEITAALTLVLGGGLFFTFRELNRARKHNMSLRREASRLKRKLQSQKKTISNIKTIKEAQPPSTFLEQSLSETQKFFDLKFPNMSIEQLEDLPQGDALILGVRFQLLQKELNLRLAHNQACRMDELISALSEDLLPLLTTSTSSLPDTPINQQPQHAPGNEASHYKQLYNELLVTLKRSRDTIRGLALKLSELMGEGMDEEQLNLLLTQLNASMDMFGELSGIVVDEKSIQVEEEVKEIRRAYEQGMNLMEHFESATKEATDLVANIKDHISLVDSNRLNMEQGSTFDRETAINNNKRYRSVLKDASDASLILEKELNSAKSIIGSFLNVTRKYQDQSTRIAILQSREKQLNSDLQHLKKTHHESIEHIKNRNQQLAAMHQRYVEQQQSEYIEKVCLIAGEIYQIEKEINELDQQEKTTSNKKKRSDLIEQRLKLESKIQEQSH